MSIYHYSKCFYATYVKAKPRINYFLTQSNLSKTLLIATTEVASLCLTCRVVFSSKNIFTALKKTNGNRNTV